jgi:hypothetical protein
MAPLQAFLLATSDLPPKNWSTCKVIITPKAG